jgi:hypothetical protein
MAMGLAAEVRNDPKAQKFLKEALTNIIKDLNIMIDAISKLVESGAIGRCKKQHPRSMGLNKIKENKETVGAELREEFAKRYEHDKGNMIEAIDKMMNEKLSEEISKFVEDRKALAQEKIAYKET